MNFDYHNPVDIHFGRHRLPEAGPLTAQHGNRALIVTGKHAMRQHGHTDKLETALDNANVHHVSFEQIGPNPLTTTVDRGAHLARQENCDIVIGLGGGSAMDAAKAIAVAAVEEPPFWRFTPTGGDADLDNADALPLICIPTTSGTGSEADQYSVISNPDTAEKPGLGCSAMYPTTSIVDPALTDTMPPRLTADTGIDILIHDLEALVATDSTPVADALALESLHLLQNHLVPAYRDPTPEDRDAVALASTLAGMAISSAGTGLIHALEHPISGHNRNVAHAQGLAALTLPILQFNHDAEPEKYRRAAQALGGENILHTVTGLFNDLDMPTTLSEIGVETDPDTLADDALRTMADTVESNPVTPTREQMINILKRAR